MQVYHGRQLDELELASKLCSSPRELGFFYTVSWRSGRRNNGRVCSGKFCSILQVHSARSWYHKLTARHNSTRLAAQHQQHFQWGVQKPWEPIKRPSAVTTCVDFFPTGSFTNFSISNPNCLNYYPAFWSLLLAWLSETFQARTCNVVVFSQAIPMHVGSVAI